MAASRVISFSTGAAQMVPTFVAADEVFLVPANQQALFSLLIDAEGDIFVDGALVEVA